MQGVGKLILGSGSASRRDILTEMGLEFDIVKADIDEKAIRCPKAEDLVCKIGNAKADAVLDRIKSEKMFEDVAGKVLLLTGDQVVVHQGEERSSRLKDGLGGDWIELCLS